jgi:hypothetical protein
VTDHDPVRTALREARRQQRLGDCVDVCIICGEPALRTVSNRFGEAHGISRSLVEQHHVVGKQRDTKLVVPLCLTHHWKMTVRLREENVSMRREQDQRKFVAQCLRALIAFLRLLVPAMENWVDRLDGGRNR